MNIDLAEKVLAHVKAHPKLHDQSTWHCGTTACLAGWTVALSGEVAGYPEMDSSRVYLKDGPLRTGLFADVEGASSPEVYQFLIPQAALTLLAGDEDALIQIFYNLSDASAIRRFEKVINQARAEESK